MKRILLTATALTLLALPSLGQTIGGPLGNGTNANMQSGVNAAISTGQLGSNIGDTTASGGAGGTGTGGTATANGGTAAGGASRSAANGGSVTNTITGGNQPSTIRNTPSVALGLATAYCQNSAGVGGSGPGFSFQAIMGRHDADCVRFNYGILLESMGEREAALLVIANNLEVNAAITEARKRAAVVPAASAITVPSYCVTQASESAADRLMREGNCGR